MMKALLVLLALALPGNAQATQYTVQFTPPFQATPEVGEFVKVFVDYGFCQSQSCAQSCSICLQPGAYQWGIADESTDCSPGEEWQDFVVGLACVPPPYAPYWYEIVGHPSANCWILEPCPSEVK